MEKHPGNEKVSLVLLVLLLGMVSACSPDPVDAPSVTTVEVVPLSSAISDQPTPAIQPVNEKVDIPTPPSPRSIQKIEYRFSELPDPQRLAAMLVPQLPGNPSDPQSLQQLRNDAEDFRLRNSQPLRLERIEWLCGKEMKTILAIRGVIEGGGLLYHLPEVEEATWQVEVECPLAPYLGSFELSLNDQPGQELNTWSEREEPARWFTLPRPVYLSAGPLLLRVRQKSAQDLPIYLGAIRLIRESTQ